MGHAGHILLINPHWTHPGRKLPFQFRRVWPPLELAVMAALLEKEGLRVHILDNHVEQRTSRAIGDLARRFDSVWVTSSPYDRWQCPPLSIGYFLDTLRHIPRERLFIMGAHATERPQLLLEQTGARAAVLGEPEQTVLALIRRLYQPIELRNVPGIAYMSRDQFIRTDPPAAPLDLNRLPDPAFHLLPLAAYRYPLMGRQFAILEGSRGCPHQCRFCYQGMFGRGYRRKRLNRFVAEIERVTRRFRIRHIYFMDLQFGASPGDLIRFSQALIDKRIRLDWCCQTRAQNLTAEALGWMQRAGCSLIHIGAETASNFTLARMDKRLTAEQISTAVARAHQAGIRTALFFNFGFPGETPAEMNATIGWACRVNPTYAAFHALIPYPGTLLAQQLGIDARNLPADHYPHYDFIHHDPLVLKKTVRRAYLRFYGRPAFWIAWLRHRPVRTADQAALFWRALIGA